MLILNKRRDCIHTHSVFRHSLLFFLTAFDLHRLLAEELYFNTLVLIIRSLVHLSQDNCRYL